MATNDTLKTRRIEAEKIVDEIKGLSEIIEKNLEKSKIVLSEIVVNSREPKRLKTSLKRIISSTDEAVLKFRKERDKVSSLLTQVNNFYNKKYLPLLEKIEDENTGFRARLKFGTQFKNEINRLKESSKKQYDEVKNYATLLRKSYKELNTIDRSIRKLLQNSTNKNNQINEINTNVIRIEAQLTQTHKSLEKLYIKSQSNEKAISDLLKKANIEYEELTNIKTESKQLLQDIQDIYEIAAETGLSGEFDKRRKHLKESLKLWEGRVFITTLVLLGVIILIFIGQLWLYNWDIKSNTFDVNFYIRFLLASPIVYYLYFCSSQYSQSKKLHDKYSFKTTLAMSIQHHIQLLTQHEKFDTEERINKILEFVLNGFQKIYTEPHTNDDYKLKLKLANMEVDIEKRLINALSKSIGIRDFGKK